MATLKGSCGIEPDGYPAGKAPILVLDVWYDPLAGMGQTKLKLRGRVRAKMIRRTAIEAARAEMRIRLPIEVDEPPTPVRLRKGPLLPDGSRSMSVDWVVGHPSAKIRHSAERILLRACVALSRK